MAISATASKRRVDAERPEGSGLPRPKFVKHDRFWVETVFVQIKDTRMQLVKSTLKSSSTFFRDVFRLNSGRPTSGEWTADHLRRVGVMTTEGGTKVYKLDSTGVKLQDFEAVWEVVEEGDDACV